MTIQDRLSERLNATLLAVLESREAFTPRLRNAVRWINGNQKDALLEYCTNPKKRAREVLELDGARTQR